MKLCRTFSVLLVTFASLAVRAADYPAPQSSTFVVKDFQFKSGEKLPEVKLHYYTLGTPQKDSSGRIRNAVLILVSLFERRVVILPDRGVAASLPARELRRVIGAMVPLLRDGRACDALCLGVEAVGKLLPAHPQPGPLGGPHPNPLPAGEGVIPDAVIEEDDDEGTR